MRQSQRCSARVCFNSRAHRGRDPTVATTSPSISKFQFTRPQGARLCSRLRRCCCHKVSIHAPTGGATRMTDFPSQIGRFQFTRPQGARRAHRRDGRCRVVVSIHAPTGGATPYSFLTVASVGVSIHAPTGGATFLFQVVLNAFNVSIHAPTGGATSAWQQSE